MRIRDWYFQGWERRADAEGKTQLVYTGEYYTLPAGRPRAVLTALTAALLAAYLAAALFPSAGGMWRVSAAPQLLELIPLIYLVMGLACLPRAARPMTYRDWYASWRRISAAGAWSLGFSGLMTGVQIVFLFAGSYTRPGPEIRFLLCAAACAGLSLAIVLYTRRHPCSQSMKP